MTENSIQSGLSGKEEFSYEKEGRREEGSMQVNRIHGM